jgi:nucleotide-binding universal stress UspA family protein
VYRNLLVPLDRSPEAERALAPAVALAARLDADIELVIVSSPGLDPTEHEVYLDRTARSLQSNVRPPRVIAGNDVAAALFEDVRTRPDTLVCMAAHGRRGIGSLVLGSVAEDLVRAADRPVVLVGPSVHTPPPLDVVVACIDPLTVASRSVLAPAGEMAAALDGVLRLLEVWPASHDGRAGDAVESTKLDALGRSVRRPGVVLEVQVHHDDRPSAGILDAAAECQAGLLVMMTRARAGFARAALGSVTMDVVRGAPCPVLVVPPGWAG